jgi:hypothetical protein
MGRSKAALVILIIGLVILILAPIWKWGLAPSLVKIPDTIDVTSVYDGTLTLSVDPTSLSMLPPELAVKIPLAITRRDLSQPSKSTSSVAVLKETAKAIGPGGKTFIDTTMYYALDRKTSLNVADHGADANRTGLYPLLPIGAKKQTYKFWSDDVGRTGDTKFVKTTKVSGLTTPPTECFVYEAGGPAVPTINPPLGLPKTISGVQIKSLASGIPGLDPASLAAISDTAKYPITYTKQTAVTLIGEPRTGSIVAVPSNTDTYYVDASALGLGQIKLASIHYAQTAENIAKVMDETAENFGLLNMVGLYIPLLLLILGVVLTAIGGIWFARKKPAA